MEAKLHRERARHRVDLEELERFHSQIRSELEERLQEQGAETDAEQRCKIDVHQVAQLESQLKDRVSELEEERSKHRIDVQELEGMQDSMLKQIEDEKQKCAALKARVSAAESERDRIGEEFEELTGLKTMVEERLKAAERAGQGYRETVVGLEAKVSRAELAASLARQKGKDSEAKVKVVGTEVGWEEEKVRMMESFDVETEAMMEAVGIIILPVVGD